MLSKALFLSVFIHLHAHLNIRLDILLRLADFFSFFRSFAFSQPLLSSRRCFPHMFLSVSYAVFPNTRRDVSSNALTTFAAGIFNYTTALRTL